MCRLYDKLYQHYCHWKDEFALNWRQDNDNNKWWVHELHSMQARLKIMKLLKKNQAYCRSLLKIIIVIGNHNIKLTELAYCAPYSWPYRAAVNISVIERTRFHHCLWNSSRPGRPGWWKSGRPGRKMTTPGPLLTLTPTLAELPGFWKITSSLFSLSILYLCKVNR